MDKGSAECLRHMEKITCRQSFLQFSQKLRHKRKRQLCWRSFPHEIITFVNLEEYLDLKEHKTLIPCHGVH